jgi:hypothetical protein
MGLKNPSAILDKYGIRYVLFPAGDPLTYVLKHDSNWKVAFSGDVSVMFERVGTVPLNGSSALAQGTMPRGLDAGR